MKREGGGEEKQSFCLQLPLCGCVYLSHGVDRGESTHSAETKILVETKIMDPK